MESQAGWLEGTVQRAHKKEPAEPEQREALTADRRGAPPTGEAGCFPKALPESRRYGLTAPKLGEETSVKPLHTQYFLEQGHIKTH